MHKPVDLPSIALGFRSLALAKSASLKPIKYFLKVCNQKPLENE
jgi:hypothetical protein